jgi:quercetin dioxygenase-like cupin family protein
MRNVQSSDVKIRPSLVNPKNLADIINACLPEQGAIEFQHDQEGKEHSWHTHDTDETIVVIDGALQFYWENGKEICQAGDVIELPKGTKHGSIAINGDAKYIITFENINLS